MIEKQAQVDHSQAKITDGSEAMTPDILDSSERSQTLAMKGMQRWQTPSEYHRKTMRYDDGPGRTT